MKLSSIAILCSLLLPSSVWAACDCGSTDQASPCTGQSISITVPAQTDTGLTGVLSYEDAVFNYVFNSGGGDANCGQFANGDYWVSPASGETTVTVTAITTTSPGTISADVDPNLESMGLLDGTKSYGNYSASEDITGRLPISYSGINSLVSAIQRNEAVEGPCGTGSIEGECVDAYNVVTVLSAIPENAGSTIIRPNITGDTKELLSLTDFDLTRIPTESFLIGTDTAGLEGIRMRWSHSVEIFGLLADDLTYYGEGGRQFRSHLVINDYGGGATAQLHTDLLRLMSDDHTLADKTPAIAAILSYGLDLYHSLYNRSGITTYMGQGATQWPGRIAPVSLLAALLTDTEYKTQIQSVGTSAGTSATDIGPHELGQINVGINVPVWGDHTNFSGVNYMGAYWNALMLCQCFDGAVGTCNLYADDKRNQRDPHFYIDGPPNEPGYAYYESSLGVMRSLYAVAATMPEFKDTINYPMLGQYVERVNDHGTYSANDPCTTPDSREDINTCDAYRNQNCVYYGVTWGPVDPTDENSDCIKADTNASVISAVANGYTQAGRFTSKDGTAVTSSYQSAQVDDNWSTFVTLYGSTATCDGTEANAYLCDETECGGYGWNYCGGTCQVTSCGEEVNRVDCTGGTVACIGGTVDCVVN